MVDESNRIFGIDLGTTYSSIAMVGEYGKPVIVPNMENERTTPSCVFFDEDNVIVGAVAKESARLYPEDVVSFIKRSMGEPDFLFERNGISYRAEEISALILKKMVQDAENSLGEKIRKAVITCPAYFGINHREATKAAGEIAGLEVCQIINEPTAAAIAYGSAELESKNERTVLVYDLGGGTFDITMIHIQAESIQVICTGGDHNLGGKDWDDRIIQCLVQEFQNQTGVNEDILDDPMTWQDLQITVERMKKVLTQREKVVSPVTHGGKRAKISMTRGKFEELTHDLLERTMSLVKDMLSEAREKGYESFDEIILVGGSTRMPMVATRLEKELGKAARIFDPDEAVAKGAAIYGLKHALNDELIRRVAAMTNKTEKEVASEISGTCQPSDGADSSLGMDLEAERMEKAKEAAAREVAEKTGHALPAVKRSMLKIADVSSKSFGVVVTKEKEQGVFNLVLKNTKVPVTKKKEFFTSIPDQKTVLIRIMESENSSEWFPESRAVEIGDAVLRLPPGLPVDTPIDISFSLNQEGRLHISAQERTGEEKIETRLETASVISRKEMERARERCDKLRVY